MNGKMKSCFTGHAIMHTAIGFGLGLIAVNLMPSLGMLWLGLVIVVVAAAMDMMRKG